MTSDGAVFLDTSAIIALANPADQFHRKITDFLERIESGAENAPAEWIVSNLILAEALTFGSRYGALNAVEVLQRQIFAGGEYRVVWIDAALHEESGKILRKFSDQKLSFADAASFAIMRKLKIRTAVSFDRDFVKVGFDIVP